MFGGLIKSSSRIAMIAAAGVVCSGIAAKAADLGGDCCADLEERVAELEATTARKGNSKVSLTVYGQVNRALLWHDSDTSPIDKFTVRDNDGRSGSRFGFKGSAQINADWSAGYRMEIGVDNSDASNASFGNRHTFVYIKSKDLGTIKLGRTSTATDGIAEIALASTITPYSCEEAGEIACGAVVGIDGGRASGIHYSSPTFAGFTLSASYFHTGGASDVNPGVDGYDVALRYAAEYGAIRVAAGVGYALVDLADDDESERISGSASVMHVPTGLFLNASAGQVTDTIADVETEDLGYYVSGGITGKWNTLGATTFEVGYGESDLDAEDGTPSLMVVGVTQDIDAAAMQFYANYQITDADTVDSDDVSALTVGAIVKF